MDGQGAAGGALSGTVAIVRAGALVDINNLNIELQQRSRSGHVTEYRDTVLRLLNAVWTLELATRGVLR